jgi:hypothetical protein
MIHSTPNPRTAVAVAFDLRTIIMSSRVREIKDLASRLPPAEK